MKTHLASNVSLISIQGIQLQVEHIAAPALATGRAPIVFLHEGLGSVAMWRNWPHQVCKATGREGWVYSRRGYGDSDPVPDVRGESRLVDGQRQGRLLPDYMHHEAWSVSARAAGPFGRGLPFCWAISVWCQHCLLARQPPPGGRVHRHRRRMKVRRHLGAINRTGAHGL
ncbi:hypothetical protein [Candidatus Aalborgicola defluviihabitans]|uniref:hypothetical protein n=1 Tax=Candidatus Aalborgicola defluviihabitans TaxID=3386187 RepID=UPI0039B92DFF